MPDSLIRAAVVVLYRHVGDQLQVYWTRRARGLSFLGGFWAFPGGQVDSSDERGAADELAALRACASRELAEETGVVVAPGPRYVALGRTTTPPAFKLRYQATYFLLRAPEGSEPDVSVSQGELDAGEWVTPARAVELWERAERFTTSVLLGVMRAMNQGLDGIVGRAASSLEGEEHGRLHDLFPGLSVMPVRTPTLPPATHTNCYVVGGPEMVVIDPASPYAEEQTALETALDALSGQGRRVVEIWLTHHHVDHVSGAARLARTLGVPVAAHRTTARLLEGKVPVSRHIADDELRVLPGGAGASERRLRALFTPGHAPGHLCFFEETTRLLICGDMVAGEGTILVDPDEGDMVDYLASLRRLMTLDARLLCAAHGPMMVNVRDKLNGYVEHRLWREKRVLDALAVSGQASPAELVTAVYDDVPDELHALAARSLEAHLIKLAKDGHATRGGDGRYATVTSLQR